MAKSGGDRERASNAVLAALARSDLSLLQPHLEAVRVESRQLLQSANRRVQHVYFLDRGFASVSPSAAADASRRKSPWSGGTA